MQTSLRWDQNMDGSEAVEYLTIKVRFNIKLYDDNTYRISIMQNSVQSQQRGRTFTMTITVQRWIPIRNSDTRINESHPRAEVHIIPPEVTFLRGGGGVATVAKPAEVGPSYLPTYIIMYKWTLIADENWIILFAYQLPRDNGRSRSGLLRISASSSLSSINYYRLFPDAGQVGKSLRAGNRASKREICLFPSRLGFKSKSSFAWISTVQPATSLVWRRRRLR